MRHSYINEFLDSNPSLLRKLHVSLMMSHNVMTQQMYQKLDVDTLPTITINENVCLPKRKNTKHTTDEERREKILESKRNYAKKMRSKSKVVK